MPLPLTIVLLVLGALLLLLLLLFLLGSAKIHIVCRQTLRVVASVCGIKFTLFSDQKKKEEKATGQGASALSQPESRFKKGTATTGARG